MTTKRIVTKKLMGKGKEKAVNKNSMETEAWRHFDKTLTTGKTGPAFREPEKSAQTSKPKFEDSLPKKPNIEKVFAAFQEFQNESRRALSGSPGKIAEGFNSAREELKDKLEEMGLAQHIDWTQPE